MRRWFFVILLLFLSLSCLSQTTTVRETVIVKETVLIKQTVIKAVTVFVTPSYTPSPQYTSTFTFTPTFSPTFTITETPTQTSTPTKTFTPTKTLIPTKTLSSKIDSCVPTDTQRDFAQVVKIIDGDTIDVVIGGKQFRVRYIGIDTPERDDYYFTQASAMNQKLVDGKQVLLIKDVSETDRYDRLLRYVLVGNTFVNMKLVEGGYAMASTYPPDVACSSAFVSAQNQASTSEVGFWRPTPESPIIPSGGGSLGSNCSPAYPSVCIPPPPPDLDCKDIPFRKFKVLSPDPHRFDGDHDGIGCESG